MSSGDLVVVVEDDVEVDTGSGPDSVFAESSGTAVESTAASSRLNLIDAELRESIK